MNIMSNFKILSLENKDEWIFLLEKLPISQQDIYYTPEYYSLYENYGDGKAKCFVFVKNGDIALYPFLINSVNELGYKLDKEYFDIQGAYGYNGVVSSSYNLDFIEEFQNSFTNYCYKNNIITEFIRFNPILKNHQFTINNNAIFHSKNIILDLSIDDIEYDAYEHSTRKNIKKARKNGVSVEIYETTEISDIHIKTFKSIYLETMKRNNAGKYYSFGDEFFSNLFDIISNNGIVVFAVVNGVYVSTEIVPFGKTIAYSFLGGTLNEYFSLRVNDILKHETINYLKEKGLKYYCLGGGTEGLLRYKKTFAKNGDTDFYIGKKIYNVDIYNQIVEQWKEKHPKSYANNNKMLLGYREI